MTRDINDGWTTLHTNEPAPGEIDEVQKVAETALREPDSLSSRRVLAQVFEREMDELHTPEGSSYFSAKPEDRAAEDRARHEERQLMAEVAAACRRALAEHGMRIETGYSEGFDLRIQDGEYVLRAKDREGRTFDVKYGLELAEGLVASGGRANLAERMGQAVAREVLKEREKYFARMQ